MFTAPGVYNVQLTVRNTAGCISDPFSIPVNVHLQPVIDAGRSYVLPQGTVVTLQATANSSSGVTFNWSPPFGLSNATVLNPTLTAMADQVYTLTAIGDFGCTATDMMTVKILKPVKVPNVFSPNGDNIHDQWVIPNLADYPGATVEVFNRYGQQVYYSTSYTPWDGTYKGKVLPAGTYYYIIGLENGFKPLNGSVTIIR
jgi:gliding motility-associated-like protein